MPVKQPKSLMFALLLSLCSLLGGPAMADDYPAKPIRMVVGFAPGGSSDLLARAVAKELAEGLKQPVVVDNRPGAGGNIGAEAVARSAADGYTVLFGTNGTLGIGPALYRNLKYDPVKDLAPVGMLHTLPNVLIVNPSLPITNVRELIDYARSRPGELSFASAGNGSASHLAAELFKAAAKIDMVHVPYKGGGVAMPDLMAGRVALMFETIPNVMSPVKAGKMRALGVTTSTRSGGAPELPTIAESGLPGFDVTSWTGLFVPAGTPRAIIKKLNAETLRIAKSPEYLAQLRQLGTDPATSSPEALGNFMRADIAKWSGVIKSARVQVD